MPDAYPGLLPRPTPETQPFWDAAREHRLLLPYCAACDAYTYYPRPFCATCFSRDVVWRECSGRGSLHTYVINHRPARGYEDKAPYVIAVVQLAEGPRMATTLVMDNPTPEKLRCDLPVEIVWDDVTDEITLPRFRLVEEA